MKYKVGQKVRVIKEFYDSIPPGSIRTIEGTFNNSLYKLLSHKSGLLSFREEWLTPVSCIQK